MHDHDKISDDIIYVLSSQLIEAPAAEYSIFVRYDGAEGLRDTFRRILKESEISACPVRTSSWIWTALWHVFNQEDSAPADRPGQPRLKFDLSGVDFLSRQGRLYGGPCCLMASRLSLWRW